MNESEPVAAFITSLLTANEAIDNFSSTDMARIGMILEIEVQTTFLVSHNQAAFIQSLTNEWVVKRIFVDCDITYRRCFTGQDNSALVRHLTVMGFDADRGLRRITIVSAKDCIKPDKDMPIMY
jgi:hypothetical protein